MQSYMLTEIFGIEVYGLREGEKYSERRM